MPAGNERREGGWVELQEEGGRARRGMEGGGGEGKGREKTERSRTAAQEMGTTQACISDVQERGVFVNAVDAECGLVRKKKKTKRDEMGGGSPLFFIVP